MIESIQVAQIQETPHKRNSTIDAHGKLRILAFDFDFTTDVLEEDLICVRIPAGEVRILGFNILTSKISEANSFNLFLVPASSYDEIMTTEQELKSAIEINSDVPNNMILNTITKSQMGSYLVIRADAVIDNGATIHGYIEYITD